MELFKPRSMKAEFELDLVESVFFENRYQNMTMFLNFIYSYKHTVHSGCLSQQDNPMCPAWAHPDPCCAVGRRTPGLSFYGCIFFRSAVKRKCTPSLCFSFIFCCTFHLALSAVWQLCVCICRFLPTRWREDVSQTFSHLTIHHSFLLGGKKRLKGWR